MKKYIILALILFSLVVTACDTGKKTSVIAPRDSLGGQNNDKYYFQNIKGLTCSNDKLFALDSSQGKVFAFNLYSFEYLNEYCSTGKGPGELSAPEDIAVIDDSLYITDVGNRKLAAVSLSNKTFREMKTDLLFYLSVSAGKLYAAGMPFLETSVISVLENGKFKKIAEPNKLFPANEDKKNDRLYNMYSFNTIKDRIVVAKRFFDNKLVLSESGESENIAFEEPDVSNADLTIFGRPMPYKQGFIQPVSVRYKSEDGTSATGKTNLYYYKNGNIVKTWELETNGKMLVFYTNWVLHDNIVLVPLQAEGMIYKYTLD